MSKGENPKCVENQRSVKGGFAPWRAITDGIPTRYLIILIAASANAVEYSLRANLSMTIVDMVKHNMSDGPDRFVAGDFDWSPTVQGIVLSAFYYGYFFTHIAGGQLAAWLGSRNIIALSLFVSSVLTILTPLASYVHVALLIVLRIITGISQGVLTPGIYTMFSHWIPPQERSTALAFIDVGANTGSLVTMLVSGFLCKHGFAGGWPSVFYTLGTFGGICFLLWLWIVHDTPEKHPKIKHSEVVFLKNNIDVLKDRRSVRAPWKSIVTSRAVWSIAIAKFCGQWGLLVFMTKLPAYLASVLHLPIDQNGTINSLVYICLISGMAVTGFMSDYIARKNLIEKTTSRKLFLAVGFIGPSIALALIPMLSFSKELVIALLMLSMLCYGFHVGGDNPIVVDIAPEFAGSVYGLCAAMGSAPGFIAPIFVGYLLDLDPGNPDMWNIVFYSTAGIYVFGAFVFITFATAKPQPWGVRLPETT